MGSCSFFLLFEHFRLTPPIAIVVAMSLGSVGNPLGFLALAVRPDLPQKPATLSTNTSTQAILGVVHAVRFGSITKKS